MLQKLTPNLMVEDVDRTVDYYKDLLGFELLTSVPEARPFTWAMMKRDGVDIMFQKRASLEGEVKALTGAPIGGSLTFYIEVQDVQALYDKLKGKVEIVYDMHETFYGSKEFYFKDCNGYILSFSQSMGQS